MYNVYNIPTWLCFEDINMQLMCTIMNNGIYKCNSISNHGRTTRCRSQIDTVFESR